MKFLDSFFFIFFFCFLCGCGPSKKLQTTSNRTDTSAVVLSLPAEENSSATAKNFLNSLREKRITFNTLSAKIKVDYEDKNGRQPDFNAFVRLQKDKVLWISINATFLNIEAFRILITPDSVKILNKLEKTIEQHPFNYLSQFARIPLTFSILQDIIAGNPVYVSDSIASLQKLNNVYRLETVGDLFTNVMSISADDHLLTESKLTDATVAPGREALFTYDNYEPSAGFYFPTERQIIIFDKDKVEIKLSFKQFEFNKELSFPFSIPQNYKTK